MQAFVEVNAREGSRAYTQCAMRHAQTHCRTHKHTRKQGYWEREGTLEGRPAAKPGSVVSIQKRNRPLKA